MLPLWLSVFRFPLGYQLRDGIPTRRDAAALAEHPPGNLSPVGDCTDNDFVRVFTLSPIELPSRTNSNGLGYYLGNGYHILRGYSGFHDLTLIMDSREVNDDRNFPKQKKPQRHHGTFLCFGAAVALSRFTTSKSDQS